MLPAEYERLDRAEETLWWFRALRLFLGKLLPNGRAGQKALDIGCGTGGLLHQLDRANYLTTGVDLSVIGLAFAKKRTSAYLSQASANQLPFVAAAFDLVTCVDLLEVASVQPAQLVSEALRVLKPGGQGLFVMAAHQWLLSEHDRAVNSVRRFNLHQLKGLFSNSQVRIMRGTYLFFFLLPLVAVRKLLNPPKQSDVSTSDVSVPFAPLNVLFYAVCWLEAQLLIILNMPTGSSVLVLVKKNG